MTFQDFKENVTTSRRVEISCQMREFPLRYSYMDAFKLLNNDEVGEIVQAVASYCFDGKETHFNELYMQMMYEVMKGDVDFAAYEYMVNNSLIAGEE